MLDLEKKMESRTEEIHIGLKRDLAKALDDRDLKQDITDILDDKVESLEYNFNNKIVSRVELLEKAYDHQIKNY